MPRAPRSPRFATLLAVIVLLAAGLRVTYVITVTRHDDHFYDAAWYELEARTIAEGEGFFVDPFEKLYGSGEDRPAADHPPLTVLVLVPAGLLGGGSASNLAMRFTMVLVGCATVLLVGLLGRRLAGELVGLVAAGIAAVDPNLWMNDGLIMSESLGTLLTVGLVLMVLAMLRRPPSLRDAAALGALAALAALTRAELALLAVVLITPVLVVRRAPGWVARAAMTALVGLLLVMPWVGWNMARFERPTTISTSLGMTLNAGSCPTTFHGERLGWSEVFPPCTPELPGLEPSVRDAELRSRAVTYVREHLGRLPVVVAARVGRVWQVFRVDQTAELTSREGRPVWATWMGAVATWALVPLAVAGAVGLRRRRVPVWPLVAPLAVTTVVAAGLGGILRYRAQAEPALVVLAAAGVVILLERCRRSPEPPRPAAVVSPAGAPG